MTKIEGIEPDDEEAAYAEDERIRIEALHKTAPEVIWLQIDDEAEQFDGWEAQTWCSDKINDSDVEYVRTDQLRAAQVKCLRDAATDFRYSNGTEDVDKFLFRMADEIERSGK